MCEQSNYTAYIISYFDGYDHQKIYTDHVDEMTGRIEATGGRVTNIATTTYAQLTDDEKQKVVKVNGGSN